MVHDELFDFALKIAKEANLDARAISKEDGLLFFNRTMAKIHGVNLNNKFSRVSHLKEIRAKEKERGTVLRPLHHHGEVIINHVISLTNRDLTNHLSYLQHTCLKSPCA